MDYRPPGAGVRSPLERQGATRGGSVAGTTGLEHLTASQKREAAEHDRNIRDYSPEMVQTAFSDVSWLLRVMGIESIDLPTMSKREAKDFLMNLRWLRSRKAALMRLGSSMRERGLA